MIIHTVTDTVFCMLRFVTHSFHTYQSSSVFFVMTVFLFHQVSFKDEIIKPSSEGSFKTCGYGAMPRWMCPDCGATSLLLAAPVSPTASLCTASFTENINIREQCKRFAAFIQRLGWRFSSMSSAALYCSCRLPRLCAHLLYCKTRRI